LYKICPSARTQNQGKFNRSYFQQKPEGDKDTGGKAGAAHSGFKGDGTGHNQNMAGVEMMFVNQARNVCEALPKTIQHLLECGVEEKSRAGKVLVAPHPVMTATSFPRERVLFRTSAIFRSPGC
jgi:hypothetical protein